MRSESNSRKAVDKNEREKSSPPSSEFKWNPAEIRPNSITVFWRNILAYSKVDWSSFLGLYIKAQWVEWFYTLGLFCWKKAPAELSNRYATKLPGATGKRLFGIAHKKKLWVFLYFPHFFSFELLYLEPRVILNLFLQGIHFKVSSEENYIHV